MTDHEPIGPPGPAPRPTNAKLPWVLTGVATLIAVVSLALLVLGGSDGDSDDVGSTSDKTPVTSDDDTAVTSTSTQKEPSAVTSTSTAGSAPTTAAPTTAAPTTATPTTTAPPATAAPTTAAPTTAVTPTTATPTTINFSLPPVFGTKTLIGGFVPDPYTVPITSGGPVNVNYVSPTCHGYASAAPSYSVHYTKGTFNLLRFYFIASGDTAIVVNTPSGAWVCADDTYGTLNPSIDFTSPATGRYDIWITSVFSTSAYSGVLHVTETSLMHP